MATGHNHIVEPDRLTVLPKLFRGIALVVAVMFEPEAIHFQIHVVAPADAGEFADQRSIIPHRLFAVALIRGHSGQSVNRAKRSRNHRLGAAATKTSPPR